MFNLCKYLHFGLEILPAADYSGVRSILRGEGRTKKGGGGGYGKTGSISPSIGLSRIYPIIELLYDVLRQEDGYLQLLHGPIDLTMRAPYLRRSPLPPLQKNKKKQKHFLGCRISWSYVGAPPTQEAVRLFNPSGVVKGGL